MLYGMDVGAPGILAATRLLEREGGGGAKNEACLAPPQEGSLPRPEASPDERALQAVFRGLLETTRPTAKSESRPLSKKLLRVVWARTTTSSALLTSRGRLSGRMRGIDKRNVIDIILASFKMFPGCVTVVGSAASTNAECFPSLLLVLSGHGETWKNNLPFSLSH